MIDVELPPVGEIVEVRVVAPRAVIFKLGARSGDDKVQRVIGEGIGFGHTLVVDSVADDVLDIAIAEVLAWVGVVEHEGVVAGREGAVGDTVLVQAVEVGGGVEGTVEEALDAVGQLTAGVGLPVGAPEDQVDGHAGALVAQLVAAVVRGGLDAKLRLEGDGGDRAFLELFEAGAVDGPMAR